MKAFRKAAKATKKVRKASLKPLRAKAGSKGGAAHAGGGST